MARSAKRLTVLLAGCDEYTALLVARHLTDAKVITTPSRVRPDLVVVEAAEPAAMDVARRAKPRAVIALADASGHDSSFANRTLIRPFLPAALFDAIDDEVQQPARDRARPTVLAAVRFGFIALGTGVRGLDGTLLDAAPVAAALAYGILRLFVGRHDREARVADVVVACALVATTGGARSGFLPFAILATVSCGSALGWRSGAAAGGVVSILTGAGAVETALHGTTPVAQAVAMLALFPLSGIVGAVGRSVAAPEHDALLSETNRLLTRLHNIAREAPGGMDAATVSEAILDEMRGQGIPAAAVVHDHDDALRIRASYGISATTLRDAAAFRDATVTRLIDVDQIDPGARASMGGYRRWIVAPAVRGARVHGLLLAAVGSTTAQPGLMTALSRLATEASVAFENATLLRRVRALATGEERRRIATRVHDGLAQTLTHLRLEVEFIARHASDAPTMREELTRMTGVLDRAVGDVHSLMNDLRQDPTKTSGPSPHPAWVPEKELKFA